ncbi:hypothetical protein ACHAXN_009547 [Cyclotella atomus]
MPRSLSTNTGPVAQAITEKLTAAFAPSHLEVRNESHMHNVPTGSETHFKVIVISSLFDSKTPIAKHRLVNNALKEVLDGPVHALSIVAMTPEKYEKSIERGEVIGSSPSCRGGDGSLPKKNAL